MLPGLYLECIGGGVTGEQGSPPHPFLTLPFLRSGPPKIQLGSLGIWCILALKSDIWWQQF